jgi:hypothetical protein
MCNVTGNSRQKSSKELDIFGCLGVIILYPHIANCTNNTEDREFDHFYVIRVKTVAFE